MSADLVEWLRAQLDEDERSGGIGHCADCSRGSEYAGTMYECDVDAARDRVLRDIEAKRLIIIEHEYQVRNAEKGYAGSRPNNRVLRYLASIYDARPGYREEWRP